MVDKTNVKFLSGSLSDIDKIGQKAGQILFVTDTNTDTNENDGYIYFDVSQDLRLKMGAKADHALMDASGNTFTTTYFSGATLDTTGAKASFVFSKPNEDKTTLDLTGATKTKAGLVTTSSQSWIGLKTLYGNTVAYKPSASSNSSSYRYDVQLKLVGDTYGSSSASSLSEKAGYVLLSGNGTTFRLIGMSPSGTLSGGATHWTAYDLIFNLASKSFGSSDWKFTGNSKTADTAGSATKATTDASDNTFTSTYLSNVLLTKAGDKNTFTFSTPDVTETVIDLTGASTEEAGLVTTGEQKWTGLKGFYRSNYSYYSQPNDTTPVYNNSNIRLYGDTLTASPPTKNYIDLIAVGTQQKFTLRSFVFSEDDTEHGYYTRTSFDFNFEDKELGSSLWTFKGNAETATHALTADEASKVAWDNITSRPLSSIVSSVSFNKSTGNLLVSTLDNTELTNGTINVAPLDQAGGTIPLDFIPLLSLNKIPQGALDRLIKVANESALLALTTNEVQLGDSVLDIENKVMYVVTDESKLGSKEAFQEYKADTALRAFSDEDGNNIKSTYFSSISSENKGNGFIFTLSKGNSDATAITIPLATTTVDGLMSKADKEKMGDFGPVITFSKVFTDSQFTDAEDGWVDTGIEGTSLDSGTYIVQLYNDDKGTSGFYKEYWSGIMSWFSGTTNSQNADEILLHNCGYADTTTGKDLYLRTIRSSSTGTKKCVRLQIGHGGANPPSTMTVQFKFRRVM